MTPDLITRLQAEYANAGTASEQVVFEALLALGGSPIAADVVAPVVPVAPTE